MAKRKTKSNKKDSRGRNSDVAEQLEQAFLAGLGALANAQKAGSKAFDTLVDQGKSFSKQTTHKSEELIGDVQSAIRGMASDAQSKASGLLDQMRETPQLEKIQGAFDSRVADALNRIGVASKHDIDALNRKLDRLVDVYSAKKRTKKKAKRTSSRKKTAGRSAPKTAAKKTARKPAAKPVAKKAPAKAAPKKRATRKVSTKAAPKKRATKKASTKTASKKRATKKS